MVPKTASLVLRDSQLIAFIEGDRGVLIADQHDQFPFHVRNTAHSSPPRNIKGQVYV